DGGIMVSLGELATISAENLPVVVLVFTDGGYGVLRNIQEKQYGRHVGVDLGRPDFCALARSLGLPSARVGTAGAFGRVVRGALASKAPFLLEVDLQSIGPMREPYTGTSKRPETARSS
ncbi:MAG TPA: thiamine pyrophosphate-dependent enzyme, partial [Acidimicrobiales bacterium]|nr:thiamine pyrophosphate-dependent enzyme [Acidimicrobiales bacterium]